MPLVELIHPLTRRPVDFDHFQTDKSFIPAGYSIGRAAFPPWMASEIGRKAVEDVRHATFQLTATGTMTCPRQTFLKVHFNYARDPNKEYLPGRGTVMHCIAADGLDREQWYAEAGFRTPTDPQVHLEGKLFGVPISGNADAIRRDLQEILDWKFPSDWNTRYRTNYRGKAKTEHTIQLNILRLLLAQQPWAKELKYDPDNVLLTVWDMACSAETGPEPLTADHHDEAWMLQQYPGQSAKHILRYRVRDYIETAIAVEREWSEISDEDHKKQDVVEEFAAAIPLMGEPQYSGQMCPKYCPVESICSRLVAKHGRPDDFLVTDDPLTDDCAEDMFGDDLDQEGDDADS